MHPTKRKKLLVLQVVVVLYLFLIIPLLMLDIQDKQKAARQNVLGAQTPTQTSCPQSPSHVVIALDTSVGTLSQAKTTAAQLTSLLTQNPQNAVGLVTFGQDAALVDPLATDEAKLQLDITEASQSAVQGVCIRCAINKANQELLRESSYGTGNTIILLTDGHDTTTLQGKEDQAAAEREALDGAVAVGQTNTQIDTIAFSSYANTDFITSLATTTNGSYSFNPTDQLKDIVDHITQIPANGTIRGYVFNDLDRNQLFDRYDSSLPGSAVHVTKTGKPRLNKRS